MNKGRLAEWLRQRFAKPSFRNGCISSNLISSANAPMDKLVKSLLSKGRSLSVRIRVGVPGDLCGCAAERLGDGLQIRTMQVRSLSRTPETSTIRLTVRTLPFQGGNEEFDSPMVYQIILRR